MPMRPLTKTMRLFYTHLTSHKIPHTSAIGLSAYLLNRYINGDLRMIDPDLNTMWQVSDLRNDNPAAIASFIAASQRVKPATIIRWYNHWMSGGSLKCVTRSASEESRRRSKYRKQNKEDNLRRKNERESLMRLIGVAS